MTGMSQLVVTDAPDEKRQPQIEVRPDTTARGDRKKYLMPTHAHLMVHDGDEVHAGDPLLALHKTLVESERVEYERTIGKINSPNHFLQLLTNDPWFAWLSPLSQLIVSIDEAMDPSDPPTAAAIQALLKQCAQLLTPSESGSGFGKHYFEAMQRDPDVVLAHGAVVRPRNTPKTDAGS